MSCTARIVTTTNSHPAYHTTGETPETHKEHSFSHLSIRKALISRLADARQHVLLETRTDLSPHEGVTFGNEHMCTGVNGELH